MVDTTGAGDAFVGSLVYLLASYPQLALSEAVGKAPDLLLSEFVVLSPGNMETISAQITNSFVWKFCAIPPGICRWRAMSLLLTFM